MFTGGLQ
jgi:hypothetical protein